MQEEVIFSHKKLYLCAVVNKMIKDISRGKDR